MSLSAVIFEETFGIPAAMGNPEQWQCLRAMMAVPRPRASGLTSMQMRVSPTGAIYIWPNTMLSYARNLLLQTGRNDLQLRGGDVLEHEGYQLRGLRVAIVLDHAIREEAWNCRALELVRDHNFSRCRTLLRPIRGESA